MAEDTKGMSGGQKTAAGLGLLSIYTSGLAAAKQGVNGARLLRAQNKARIRQMQDQFELSTQNLHNNKSVITRQRMKNDIAIEESKLEGQDAFAQAFAGSGISGRTVDATESQMQNEVAKAHNTNAEQAVATGDRQFLGLMRQSDKITKSIQDMDNFDISASESNINMAAMNAALEEGANAARSFK